jgi:cyclase
MYRSLIVARIAPGSEDEVARIFGESDQTELPRIVGVSHRSLYALDGLYIHLLESARQGSVALESARDHPEFARVSDRLGPFISPYSPTWRSPQDAVATCFYAWNADTVGAR